MSAHDHGSIVQTNSGSLTAATLCPVMEHPVDSNTPYRVPYQGKEYLLCCQTCVEEFNSNPAHYAEVASKLSGGSN